MAANRRGVSDSSFQSMEALSDYIVRIDDLLDQVQHPSVLGRRTEYRTDPAARFAISQFVNSVKQKPLSRSEKLLKMKEDTSGAMGSILAAVLNSLERVPVLKRKELEDAFANAFMATQVADDVIDLKQDFKNRVPNLALAVLAKFPSEQKRALSTNSIRFSWFKKNCPKTYQELFGICQHYLAKIPTSSLGFAALATIPQIFWRIVELTRR